MVGWSRQMLYSGFNTLPRSVFWSADFNGRSDNLDVMRLERMDAGLAIQTACGFDLLEYLLDETSQPVCNRTIKNEHPVNLQFMLFSGRYFIVLLSHSKLSPQSSVASIPLLLRSCLASGASGISTTPHKNLILIPKLLDSLVVPIPLGATRSAKNWHTRSVSQAMLEFSAIISAVKRNKRSNQYLILAAMYFLGADKTPVKSRAISDLLNRHDQKLSNVTAGLRSYTGYVEKSNDKSPYLWLLTKKGIAHFRTLSGLELKPEIRNEDYSTDVAFICALEHPEFSSLQEATGGKLKWSMVGHARLTHVYESTTIETTDGNALSVVGTVATSMGLTAAAIATTQLILEFRPRLVVMVGIAAGTKSGNKEFGDILVADPSVDYNSGKVVFEDGVRGFLPDPYPIGLNARLRSVIQKYRAPNELFVELRNKWDKQTPKGKH